MLRLKGAKEHTGMWQKERGIVLGAVRHNDKSSVVNVFTESAGRVPYIFFMSATGKNASRNTLLQPLTQIEFQSRIIPSDRLQHMRDAQNMAPYASIPFTPGKSAQAMFLGELLSRALKEQEASPKLFKYLTLSLQWLDKADEYSNFHLKFTLDLTTFLGISPNVDDAQPGNFLDLRDGIFTEAQPPHPDFIDQDLSFKVMQLMASDMDSAMQVPLTRSSRSALLQALNGWLRLHLPDFPVLKSIEVLQALYD